jgi:hypothetical protein
MFNPYWSWTEADSVMNEIELGFRGATDESTSIMHRFAKAYGIAYDISHNYWSR